MPADTLDASAENRGCLPVQRHSVKPDTRSAIITAAGYPRRWQNTTCSLEFRECFSDAFLTVGIYINTDDTFWQPERDVLRATFRVTYPVLYLVTLWCDTVPASAPAWWPISSSTSLSGDREWPPPQLEVPQGSVSVWSHFAERHRVASATAHSRPLTHATAKHHDEAQSRREPGKTAASGSKFNHNLAGKQLTR